MKIKMKTTWASPFGVKFPGDILEVEPTVGQQLVRGFNAECLDAPTVEAVQASPEPEVSTEEPVKQFETTDMRKRKTKR